MDWLRYQEYVGLLFTTALSFLGPRMSIIINPGQVLKIQMGVDLSGADVRMPQQLLYCPQVCRRLQQMAGEGVAQQVRVEAAGGALFQGPFFQSGLNRAGLNSPPTPADEQRCFAGIGQASSNLQPGCYGLPRFASHGNPSCLGSLAGHLQGSIVEIDIHQFQRDQFGQPQAGGVEKFHDGEIPQLQGLVRGSIQQFGKLIGIECGRQSGPDLRGSYPLNRVVFAGPFTQQVSVQTAQGGEFPLQAFAGDAVTVSSGDIAADLMLVQLLPVGGLLFAAPVPDPLQIPAVVGEGVRG